MRVPMHICWLLLATVAVSPCWTGEVEVLPADMAASDMKAAFDRLLEANQGMSLDDVLGRDAKKEGTRRAVSDNPIAVRNLEAVDFIEMLRDELALTEEHLEQLRRDGVVLRRTRSDFSFPAAYYSIYVRDLPLLVTADSILHAVHRSFDEILDESEKVFILPRLKQLLAETHEELNQAKANEYPAELEQAMEDVDLYLAVARQLLNQPYRTYRGREPTKYSEHEQLPALIDKITSSREMSKLEIFGSERVVDFTQFKPRARYTNYQLSRYFRSMMWLGRSDCGWSVPKHPVSGNRELQNAILLCYLLKRAECVEALQNIDHFLSEFIGASNGFSAVALLEVIDQVGVGSLEDCCDLEKISEIRSEVNQRFAGRLTVRTEWRGTDNEPPLRFQMFAQRFAVDAYVMSQVVYDAIKVGGQRPLRQLPTGLDVMACFGNPLAVDLLRPELERWNYWRNLKAAQDLIGSLDSAYWDQSFYNGWLHSLTHLHRPFQEYEKVPTALRTRSWQLKQLQAQLASWTELRRDTLLYKGQTYTPPGCEYPAAYVEPYPELYAGFGALMKRTAAHVESLLKLPGNTNYRQVNSIKKRQQDFFAKATSHLEMLERIAQKELLGERLNEHETGFIERTISQNGNMLFGSAFIDTLQFDGWYPELIYKFKSDGFGGKEQGVFYPVIADVHTSTRDQTVLQVGTGRADMCVLIADHCEGGSCAYVGPAYSYYEFEQPMNERLDGAQWRQLLSDPQVELRRPSWIDPVMTSGAAPIRTNGDAAVSRDGANWKVRSPGGKYGGLKTTTVPVSDEGLGKIISMAPENRWYDLSESEISAAGLDQLRAMGGLRAISLAGTKIGDSGVAALSTAKYLRVLNLNDSAVDSEVMSTVGSWKYLGRLELKNTPISDSDLDVLSSHRYLRHLDLRGTKVTAHGVQRLRNKLPGLTTVLWDEQ